MEIISYVTGRGILGKLAILKGDPAEADPTVQESKSIEAATPEETPAPKVMQMDLDIESPIVFLPVGELTEETVVLRPGRITLITQAAPETGTSVKINTMTIKLTGLNLYPLC